MGARGRSEVCRVGRAEMNDLDGNLSGMSKDCCDIGVMRICCESEWFQVAIC